MTLADECPLKLNDVQHDNRKHVVSVMSGGIVCLPRDAVTALLQNNRFRVTKAQAAADQVQGTPQTAAPAPGIPVVVDPTALSEPHRVVSEPPDEDQTSRKRSRR